MALRFQRRMKLLPGVHLNLSLLGVFLSVGGRGAHIGVTARVQRYTSVGVPGTGVSWREYHNPAAHAARCDLCAPGHVHFSAWLVLVIVLVIVIRWCPPTATKGMWRRASTGADRAIAYDNAAYQAASTAVFVPTS